MAREMSEEWKQDCLKWRGRVLTGEHGHWCLDWDQLPIDETCDEWVCACDFGTDYLMAKKEIQRD